MKYDYLIVGQGIAGTMLSYSLLKRNKKVLVIDQPFSCTSLAIGGGMYSPIIFKRFTKAWMVDTLLPELINTYTELEKLLTISVLNKKSLLRVFASEQEKKLWIHKSIEESYWPYLDEEVLDHYSPFIHAPYGYGHIKNAGSVNMYTLLTAYRDYLKKRNSLIETELKYEDVHITNDGINWNSHTAEKIMFCEGFTALKNNLFFKNLPFVLAKGELLKVRIKELPEDYIISSSVNISPLGNGEFIVGSTYSWDDLTAIPTENGKEEVLTKLKKFLKVEVEVIEQLAGIRPTVKDRRPLIGLHPQQPQIGIFNGMGTKGVILAPYFAEHFVNHLLNNADLMPEVFAFRKY